VHPHTNDIKMAELELKKLQLHWLLQITKAINYNLPAEKLFEVYQSVLKDHLHITRAILFVNEDGWFTPVKFGFDDHIDLSNIDPVISDVRNYASGGEPVTGWLRQFDTIIPVSHKDHLLAYALIGPVEGDHFPSRSELVTYIHTITNVIVVAIENKRLGRESVRQAAMEKELQLAAQMQTMLFPPHPIIHEGLDIAASYIPHTSVGGDYYDFIKTSGHEALICMADVSGKGLSAAMLMSNFQANLHALIRSSGFTLETIVTDLNNCVNRSARGEKFITFFIAHINLLSGVIEYINAGHNPPVIVRGADVQVLDKGTIGLGMLDELPFLQKGHAEFHLDSLLFCYTDGITDMENESGNLFGIEQLTSNLIQFCQAESMEQLNQKLLRSFDEFRGRAGYSDDVTFLSIRLKGS
jgi:phosphoserine phosphatase RsbU/P